MIHPGCNGAWVFCKNRREGERRGDRRLVRHSNRGWKGSGRIEFPDRPLATPWYSLESQTITVQTFHRSGQQIVPNRLIIDERCTVLVHNKTNGVEIEELEQRSIFHLKIDLIWRDIATFHLCFSFLRDGERCERRYLLFQHSLLAGSYGNDDSFPRWFDIIVRFHNTLSSHGCHYQSSNGLPNYWSTVMEREGTGGSARFAVWRHVERIASEPRFHGNIKRDSLKSGNCGNGGEGGRCGRLAQNASVEEDLGEAE